MNVIYRRYLVFSTPFPARPSENGLFLAGATEKLKAESVYQHLLDLGKVPKVAVIACMCKLLSIANAMLKTGQPFRPHF